MAFNLDDRIQTGRLTLTPGLRAEHLDLQFEQDLRRADGGGSPEQGDGTLKLLGGGIGAIWEQNANWTFSGGAFRGFSPPGPRAVIRNDLEEETSISTEIGAGPGRSIGAGCRGTAGLPFAALRLRCRVQSVAPFSGLSASQVCSASPTPASYMVR